MKMIRQRKSLSFIACIVLIAAIALFTTGCNGKTNNSATDVVVASTDGESTLGHGETAFTFVVVDGEGSQKNFQINTDKKTVGEALLELGLISGDESEYGLYVKTVDGLTVDYDKDGKYWAFYVNGEYAQTGVDATDVVAGSTYSFKVE